MRITVDNYKKQIRDFQINLMSHEDLEFKWLSNTFIRNESSTIIVPNFSITQKSKINGFIMEIEVHISVTLIDDLNLLLNLSVHYSDDSSESVYNMVMSALEHKRDKLISYTNGYVNFGK